jgi:hypothetical protein
MRIETAGARKPMNLSNKTLIAATVCCALCILLSIVAIAADQLALIRISPDNRLALSQDPYYAVSGWVFLFYDLIHIFVIAVFALVLAQNFSWEAWMGGGASIVSSLADVASLCVNMFFLMTALRALAEGQATGVATPEAGFDVICSTLDFAQASFGLVGTLFLGTAAIKASGMAKVAGWFLLAGLPISFLQIAEVGFHNSWTAIVDVWVTPVNEIVQQLVIGIAFYAMLHRRPECSAGRHAHNARIGSNEHPHGSESTPSVAR